MPLTNRGKLRTLQWAFAHESNTPPGDFYVALVTNAPTVDTNTLGQLTEVANGNGYTTGGIIVAPNNTDFPSASQTEDDAVDIATVLIKNLTWTASGGTIAARYAVLTDANATVGSREVLAFSAINGDASTYTIDAGSSLTIQNFGLKLREVV